MSTIGNPFASRITIYLPAPACCRLFTHFMRMARFPKGSDVMFLNNQEDQVDPDSILTTYKPNIQHNILETNNFS
jgi:hypothetical protein